MDRFEGIERAQPYRYKERRTWDIFHVWQDGVVRDGVRFKSTLHVFVAEPRPAAKVSLWAPGGPGEIEHTLGWGEELWVAAPAWGLASAASSGDVPLHFYWELSAGKAEGTGQRGGAFEPEIRVTDPPPPGVGD